MRNHSASTRKAASSAAAPPGTGDAGGMRQASMSGQKRSPWTVTSVSVEAITVKSVSACCSPAWRTSASTWVSPSVTGRTVIFMGSSCHPMFVCAESVRSVLSVKRRRPDLFSTRLSGGRGKGAVDGKNHEKSARFPQVVVCGLVGGHMLCSCGQWGGNACSIVGFWEG